MQELTALVKLLADFALPTVCALLLYTVRFLFLRLEREKDERIKTESRASVALNSSTEAIEKANQIMSDLRAQQERLAESTTSKLERWMASAGTPPGDPR